LKLKSENWYYAYFSSGVATGGITPLVPLFVTEALQGNIAQVGIVSSGASISAIPGSILWGELSDRYAMRKIFIIVGFSGLAIALFLMALSQSVEQYLIFNCMFGFFGLAAAPIGVALVVDRSTKSTRPLMIGAFSKIGGMGIVFGFALGFLWLHLVATEVTKPFAMRMLFFIAALHATIAVILALKFIEEPYRVRIRRKGELLHLHLRTVEKHCWFPARIYHVFKFGHIAHIRKFGITISHNLSVYLIIVFVYFTGFLTFFVAYPIFLKLVAGFSEAEIFLTYLINGTTIVLAYTQAGKLAEHITPKKLAICANSIRVILFPMFAVVPMIIGANHFGILTSLIIMHATIGCTWAIITVVGFTIVGQLAPEGTKGEAMGIYHAVCGIGSVCGALLGGFMAHYFGFFVAFCTASFLILCSIFGLVKIKIR
jgi:MFS family permease